MKSTVDIKPIPGTAGWISTIKLAQFIAACATLSNRKGYFTTHKRYIALITKMGPTHVLRAVRVSVEEGYIEEIHRGTGGGGPVEIRQSTFRFRKKPHHILGQLGD